MRLITLFSSKAKLLILVLIMSIALLSVTTMGETNETITSPDGNGYRKDANGWIFLHIQGAPYERGFQHGYLLAPELAEIKRSLHWSSVKTINPP